jgi:SAM-dependent methyltransferase
MLEIGAGSGTNLPFFIQLGIPEENITANEILPERIQALRIKFPNTTIAKGFIQNQNFPEECFDIVFQSTVFSSVLDDSVRKEMAKKMKKWLKPNGIILWYDFIYNNPLNNEVRKVNKNEIINLFPDCKFKFYKVSLLPPLGRRVKNFYAFFNAFSFLRTHLIAEIKK